MYSLACAVSETGHLSRTLNRGVTDTDVYFERSRWLLCGKQIDCGGGEGRKQGDQPAGYLLP